MDTEMGYYLSPPLFTQSFLLEFDIDLVKKALTKLLHPLNGNTPIKLSALAQALNSYIEACHNVFLASERIRFFLLVSFIASTITSFIALAIAPVSTLSIGLVCVLLVLLLSTNFFILFNQLQGYQQEKDWNRLKKHYSDYTEKTHSKMLKQNSTHRREKNSNPTSPFCLFSHQKMLQIDCFKSNDHENTIKHETHLPTFDEDSFESLPFNLT